MVLAAAVGLARPVLAADPPGGYTVAPPPAWVETAELPAGDPALQAQARSGLSYLLADHQVRVAEGTAAQHQRWAWKVLTTAGVQSASELEIQFDPSFERLVLHHVRVHRQGQVIDALTGSEVKVIQRESDSAERIYDGSLTALVFVRDVRVGDVLEYAYTLDGANPILGGHYAAEWDLAYDVPVERLRHRVLWGGARPLAWRTHGLNLEPTTRDAGGLRLYEWDRRGVAAVVEDDGLPAWFDPYPWLQVTDFASWGEVARWSHALFSAPAEASPALEQLVAEVTAGGGPPEAQALRAVRFVQDDVRYLGLEIGPSAHRPHPPAQVLAQRFGDCKDKALLLATVLGRLGFQAQPALVNTKSGRLLDTWLPSPFAFDHAVLRVALPGGPGWIDATSTDQGGTLRTLQPPAFGMALVVSADTEALVALPDPTDLRPTTLVEETYLAAAWNGPVRLELRTTYRGRDADDMRQTLAQGSLAEVARTSLNYYAQTDHGVQRLGEPVLRDEREANVLVITERFLLPGLWVEGRRDFQAWSLADALEEPQTTVRSMPFAREHPLHVRHAIVVELPEPPAVEPAVVQLGDPAFRFTARRKVEGRKLLLEFSYQSLADSVAPEALRRHLATLDRLRAEIGFALEPGEVATPTSRRLPAPPVSVPPVAPPAPAPAREAGPSLWTVLTSWPGSGLAVALAGTTLGLVLTLARAARRRAT